MRLLMTLLVRDEVELVRRHLSFHLARGVDGIVATDNGSTDGTRDVLEEFLGHGVLRIIDEPGDDFSQHQWVSRMAHAARDEFGADWIVNSDADEFWHAPAGRLAEELATTRANMLTCVRRHMVFPHDRPPPVDFLDIVHRVRTALPVPALADPLHDPLPAPYFYLDLSAKVVCRARGLRDVLQGNHGASYDEMSRETSNAVAVYHYPVRSIEQFTRKVEIGGAAYARNRTLPAAIGWHWRRWYDMLRAGAPERAFQDALPSAARVSADLAAGDLIVDTTLRDTLCASC